MTGSMAQTQKGVVGEAWGAVMDLVFPVQCAGCHKWDVQLCDQCASMATRVSAEMVLEDSAGVPYAPLFGLGKYEGALRNVVLSAKHDPNHNLDRFLWAAGNALGEAVGEQLKGGCRIAHRGGFPPSEVWVVGAPPSHARKRKRMEIVPTIAQGLASGLTRVGVGAVVVDAVSLRSWRRSQAGRSEKQRRLGRSGALQLELPPAEGAPVVLVDDAVTTGATMREMVRLLHPNVVSAAALAVAL